MAAGAGPAVPGCPASQILHIRLQTAGRGGFLLYALTALAVGSLYRRLPPGQHLPPRRRHQVLPESRSTVAELAAPFSLDSAGGGFVIQSLLVLWLHLRFGTGPATMGIVFSLASLLAAASLSVAGSLAQKAGLIKTMVFTHLPADIMLAMAAFAPRAWMAIALLLGRAACSSMDVPARQSFVMAVVPPDERTAAARQLMPRVGMSCLNHIERTYVYKDEGDRLRVSYH